MAGPKEFDEEAVLDAAVVCFWSRGYEATSIRDLIETTGLTAASLYNAFGDKRALFRTALDHYVEGGIGERIRRCEALPPRAAISAFFEEILNRSLSDRELKGCMPPQTLARHLLGVLMGVPVLARVRSERALLQGAVAPALALLDGAGGRTGTMQ